MEQNLNARLYEQAASAEQHADMLHQRNQLLSRQLSAMRSQIRKSHSQAHVRTWQLQDIDRDCDKRIFAANFRTILVFIALALSVVYNVCGGA
ncbi:MAG: hypothetical protein VXW65_08445 [Pseudomonadota bacterium]|nr:hypothetical protein [Pseudomonadota bacterium]